MCMGTSEAASRGGGGGVCGRGAGDGVCGLLGNGESGKGGGGDGEGGSGDGEGLLGGGMSGGAVRVVGPERAGAGADARASTTTVRCGGTAGNDGGDEGAGGERGSSGDACEDTGKGGTDSSGGTVMSAVTKLKAPMQLTTTERGAQHHDLVALSSSPAEFARMPSAASSSSSCPALSRVEQSSLLPRCLSHLVARAAARKD